MLCSSCRITIRLAAMSQVDQAAHLVQVINALDPLCDALAVPLWPLKLCHLRCVAAPCPCLHTSHSHSNKQQAPVFRCCCITAWPATCLGSGLAIGELAFAIMLRGSIQSQVNVISIIYTCQHPLAHIAEMLLLWSVLVETDSESYVCCCLHPSMHVTLAPGSSSRLQCL